MNQQPRPQQPKRVASGKQRDWTDTDIDHLSEISQADIIQAVALWRTNVLPALASLLDAEVIEHENTQ